MDSTGASDERRRDTLVFSDWQKKRLRTRIIAYKLNGGRSGVEKSWYDVIEDIMKEDVEETRGQGWLVWPEEEKEKKKKGKATKDQKKLTSDVAESGNRIKERIDKGLPITTNVFEKWISGEWAWRGPKGNKTRVHRHTTPEPHNLMAIYQLLLFSGYLSRFEEGESPPPMSSAYSFAEFLNPTPNLPMLPLHDALDGDFSVILSDDQVSDGKSAIESRYLKIHLSADRMIYAVKETRRYYWIRRGEPTFQYGQRQERLNANHKSHFEGWGVQKGDFLVLVMREESTTELLASILILISRDRAKKFHEIVRFSVLDDVDSEIAEYMDHYKVQQNTKAHFLEYKSEYRKNLTNKKQVCYD